MTGHSVSHDLQPEYKIHKTKWGFFATGHYRASSQFVWGRIAHGADIKNFHFGIELCIRARFFAVHGGFNYLMIHW